MEKKMTRFNVYQYDRLDDALVKPIKTAYPVAAVFSDLGAARVFAVALDKKIEEDTRMKDPDYPYHAGDQYPVVLIYDTETSRYEDLTN